MKSRFELASLTLCFVTLALPALPSTAQQAAARELSSSSCTQADLLLPPYLARRAPDAMIIQDYSNPAFDVDGYGGSYDINRFDPSTRGWHWEHIESPDLTIYGADQYSGAGDVTFRVDPPACPTDRLQAVVSHGYLYNQWNVARIAGGRTYMSDFVSNPAGWQPNHYTRLVAYVKVPRYAVDLADGGYWNAYIGTYYKTLPARSTVPTWYSDEGCYADDGCTPAQWAEDGVPWSPHGYHHLNLVPPAGDAKGGESEALLNVVVVDLGHPHHMRGGPGSYDWGNQARIFPADGPDSNPGNGGPDYNLSDELTRIYFSGALNDNLGDWDHDPHTWGLGPFLLVYDENLENGNEDPEHIYGVVGALDQGNLTVTFNHRKDEDSVPFRIKIAFRNMHEPDGWANAIDLGTTVPDDAPGAYNNVVFQANLDNLGIGRGDVNPEWLYVGIKDENPALGGNQNPKFSQFAIPIVRPLNRGLRSTGPGAATTTVR